MDYKKMDIYTCAGEGEEKCDCIVEILLDCDMNGINCCGGEMKQAQIKTEDQGKEKHVPVIEKVDGGYKVKVGDVAHPMEEDHYIEFIELRTVDEVYRKYLKPGMAPEAVFNVDAEDVLAIEHCNKHGLWKG